MKRGLHRMWIRGLGLCLVVLCNPGCLNDGELCDASQGEVNLDAIRSGVDLSGWWEGGDPTADTVQRFVYIDEGQHFRMWRRADLGHDTEPTFDATDFEFGCEKYLSFPLVVGDRNVVPEERGSIWGGSSGYPGYVIKLDSVSHLDGKICLTYNEWNLDSSNNNPQTRDFCFWYDSDEDLFYATLLGDKSMVFVRAPGFDPNGE